MPVFGGVDTSKAAGVEMTARRARLQAEMQAIQDRRQTTQQNIAGITQGLGMAAQAEQQRRGESLEAARSGLEYNKDTGEYQPSARRVEKEDRAEAASTIERAQQYRHREERHQMAGAQAIEQDKIRKAQIGLAARELGIKEKAVAKSDAQWKQEHELKLRREERLTRQLRSENKEKAEKARADLEKSFYDDVAKYDTMLKSAISGTDSFVAMMTPDERARYESSTGGNQQQRAIQMIQAMRNKRVIEHAWRTGDLLMFDPTAEENAGFMTMMALAKGGLNAMAMFNPTIAKMSPKERYRFLVSGTADLYLKGQAAIGMKAVSDVGNPSTQQQGSGLGKFATQPPGAEAGQEPGAGGAAGRK